MQFEGQIRPDGKPTHRYPFDLRTLTSYGKLTRFQARAYHPILLDVIETAVTKLTSRIDENDEKINWEGIVSMISRDESELLHRVFLGD